MNNKTTNKFLNDSKQFTIVETFVGCGGAHLGFKTKMQKYTSLIGRFSNISDS